MKRGQFAMYKGQEYHLAQVEGGFLLFSEDSADRSNGFMEESPGSYSKTVSAEELESAYVYDWCAVYGGRTFRANFTRSGSLMLTHMSEEGMEEAKQLGFQKVEPSVCEKEVRPDEVEQLIEVRKPIWGFTTV